MAAYETLRAAIDSYIKANGNKEITGTVLNDILNAMVSALGADTRFAGVAVPSTNPGNPEGNVVYFASQAGTYSNFGGIVLPLGIHILVWNGTAWTSQTWFSVNNTPTQNSQNLVTSGGIFQAIVDAVGVERLRAIGAEVTSCSFNSTTKKVSFFNSANSTLFQLDATAFIIDGMVRDVKIEDGNLVIQFNTDAGKQDIEIPLTETFDPANYYTKTAIDTLLTAINNKLADGCLYRGMAEPTTNPPTPTTKVFYIATKAGTYTNFGNIAVTEGITILKYDGSNWSKEQISYCDGVFDISAYNGTSYADLSSALGTNGANIPQNLRKGGMSVKFVQSSDNNYVQFCCKTQTFSANPENWAICDNGWYIDNPEFIKVLTDKDGKILIALEADGNVRFGAGVPKQIIEYVESNIDGSVEEIKAFLEGLGNTTLKDYLDNTYGEYIDNPEWVKVITDNSGGILAGIKADGSVDWTKGIPTPLKEALNYKVDKEIGKALVGQDIVNSIYYISNEEFVFAIIDAEDKLLFGIRKDGTTFANDSVYSTPENIVNEGLINNYDNMLQLKALLDLPSGADVMIGFKDSSFQWVKTQNITDAWRNYTIDLHDGYVIIRDDSATIQVNASTICSGETKLAMAHLIPFDYDRLNTDKNMAIMVYCKNQNKLMRCDISTLSNALNAANWTECKLWEKRGTKRKIPTKVLAEVDSFHRFDTTLDNSCYQYSSVNTTDSMIQFQGMRPMHSLMNNIARSKRMVVWGDYINTNSNEIGRPCIWITTDGAENIVAAYDFCFDDSSLNYVFSIASEINTSAFADYSGGLRLYKVTRNIPSSENTDPWKYANSEITGFTITKGTKTVINKTAHGLVDGDIVRFAGTLTDNEWSQLQSNLGNEDARNFMGDNVYYVKKIDDNSFYLREFMGSYDNSLSARHIHSVNECKSGFVAYTGEEYPSGWGILLQYLQNAPIHPCDVMKKTFTFLRLNSSENSVQRCCGFLMGGETDPICFAFSDTDNAQLGHMAIGDRVYNLPAISPNGIWKGHLSEIDAWNKWDCVCAVPETAIWTYRYGRVIVTYWQSNGWTISLDGGKNFSYYAQVPIVSTNFCGVHNNRIVINNGYELHPLDFAKVESEY